MTTATERFMDEYGITEQDAKDMRLLARQAMRANERCCNGDAHTLSKNPTDKNANTELWGHDLDRITDRLQRIVSRYGFDVTYTGLRPCLVKDGRYVEIPV